MLPRSPQDPKVGAKRSKNSSKIDPGRGQERVLKPPWHRNAEMSPNLIIYYTLATPRQVRERPFITTFGSKLVPKGGPKENGCKIIPKSLEKCPISRPGRQKVVPRLPKASQNGDQNPSKFDGNSIWGWTWPSWL